MKAAGLRRFRFAFACLLLSLMFPASGLGQLRPDECVLIFNSRSQASRGLAEYYAGVRGVPADQLLGVPLSVENTLSRQEYETLAAEVRRFLNSHAKGDSIRCLVTFYDVPLKVAAPPMGEQERKRRQELQPMLDSALAELRRLLDDAQGKAANTSQPTDDESSKLSLTELADEYRILRSRLGVRMNVAGEADPQAARHALLRLVTQVEGRAAIAELLKTHGEPPSKEAALKLDRLMGQVADVQQTIEGIHDEGPMSPRYGEALELLAVWRGPLGVCRWLDRDMRRLAGEECHAALDSELSLVLREHYDLYRWLPNRLNPEAEADGRTDLPATMMVSRIDAPAPEIARRMIDDAIAVERTGLAGTFYIDTRRSMGADAYRQYDQDLLDLHLQVLRNTEIPAVVDHGQEVFAAGTCPNAALYCGWYSAAEYVPAFEFVRGAVGFHIASFELVSLREPDKHYWCPGLLRDGVAATLGPTSEPYLLAFPRPTRFFGLLLTGRFTLVECFYRSKPFNSWQMALLGDPLYRPFAKDPQLDLADVE